MNAAVASGVRGNRSLLSSQTGNGSSNLPPFLLLQPSTSWDYHAVCHFLHHYTLIATEDTPSHLGFLPELLSSNPNCQYLYSAILAAGSAGLANMANAPPINTNAGYHYGRALKQISAAIQDPHKASPNTLLSSIILLQHYEVFDPVFV